MKGKMFTILRFQDPVTRTSASTYSLAGESLRKAALVEIPAISGSAYEQRGPPVAVTAAQSALTFAEMVDAQDETAERLRHDLQDIHNGLGSRRVALIARPGVTGAGSDRIDDDQPERHPYEVHPRRSELFA